jgi:hypothetical protein
MPPAFRVTRAEAATAAADLANARRDKRRMLIILPSLLVLIEDGKIWDARAEVAS